MVGEARKAAGGRTRRALRRCGAAPACRPTTPRLPPSRGLFSRPAKTAPVPSAPQKPAARRSLLAVLDFQENIEEDAILIAKARGMKKGDKMSPAQYAAMRRKVRVV